MKEKWKVLNHVLTLCDTRDYRVLGILWARILEWMPFPSPGDLPNPGIEPRDRTQVSCITGRFFTSWATRYKSPNLAIPHALENYGTHLWKDTYMKIHYRTLYNNEKLEITQMPNKKMVKWWYIHVMQYYTAHLHLPWSSKSS